MSLDLLPEDFEVFASTAAARAVSAFARDGRQLDGQDLKSYAYLRLLVYTGPPGHGAPTRCLMCQGPVETKPGGRWRWWCSNACSKRGKYHGIGIPEHDAEQGIFRKWAADPGIKSLGAYVQHHLNRDVWRYARDRCAERQDLSWDLLPEEMAA